MTDPRPSGDATDRKVRRQLREGLTAPRRDPSRYSPVDWCRCLHHRDEHHGGTGDGPCSVCGCTGFAIADLECPDCLIVWSMVDEDACPVCGLSVAAVAAWAAAADAPTSERFP